MLYLAYCNYIFKDIADAEESHVLGRTLHGLARYTHPRYAATHLAVAWQPGQCAHVLLVAIATENDV